MALQGVKKTTFDFNGDLYTMRFPGRDRYRSVHMVVKEIFVNQIYSGDRCYVSPGDVVIDGGAYVGMFSLYALIRGARTVLSVEPVWESLDFLKTNLETFGNRIVPINNALWSTNRPRGDRLKIRISNQLLGSCVSEPNSPRIRARFIAGVTIDQLVHDYSLDRVDFIKLDVEGSEMEALKGAVNTIERFKPSLAVSLYHKPADRKKILAFIKSLGVYGDHQEKGMEASGILYLNGLWGVR